MLATMLPHWSHCNLAIEPLPYLVILAFLVGLLIPASVETPLVSKPTVPVINIILSLFGGSGRGIIVFSGGTLALAGVYVPLYKRLNVLFAIAVAIG